MVTIPHRLLENMAHKALKPPGLRLVVKEDRRWLAGRQAERREKAEILKD